MENVTILDGLILTVVSMALVYLVLAALWGFIELVHRFIGDETPEPAASRPKAPAKSASKPLASGGNPKLKKAAEIVAVLTAYEEDPSQNYEIVESKKIN